VPSTLLSDRIRKPRQQNNEEKRGQFARFPVVFIARILSYEAILEAEKEMEDNQAKAA
jgi:hypothetical protein